MIKLFKPVVMTVFLITQMSCITRTQSIGTTHDLIAPPSSGLYFTTSVMDKHAAAQYRNALESYVLYIERHIGWLNSLYGLAPTVMTNSHGVNERECEVALHRIKAVKLPPLPDIEHLSGSDAALSVLDSLEESRAAVTTYNNTLTRLKQDIVNACTGK